MINYKKFLCTTLLSIVLLISFFSIIPLCADAQTNYYVNQTPAMNKQGAANMPTYGATTDATAPVQSSTVWKINFDGSGPQWAGWRPGSIALGPLNVSDVVTVSGYYKIPADYTGNYTSFGLIKTDYSNWVSTQDTMWYIKDNQWHYFTQSAIVTQAYTSPICADIFSVGFATYTGSVYVNGLSVTKNYTAPSVKVNVTDTQKTVVCIGDSITNGSAKSYPSTLGYRLPNWTIINEGHSGDTTYNMTARFSTDVTANNPDYVIILGGINNHGDVTGVENNLTQMYTWALTNGTIPIACTLTPYYPANDDVQTINTWIRAYASENNIPLIDFYNIMNNQSNPGHMPDYFTVDTLHPNDVGFTYMGVNIDLNSVFYKQKSLFTADNTTIKAGETITFTDYSINASTQDFSFGDDTTNESSADTTHTYETPGVYTAILTTTTSGITDTYSMNITVGIPAPTANFSVSAFSGTNPLTVQFTDLSTGTIDSWAWNFGDGSANSTEQNPSHTYTTAGSYTVMLTVTNDGGSSTYALADQIHATKVPTTGDIDFGADDVLGEYWPLYIIMIFIAVAAMLFIPTIGMFNTASGKQRSGRAVKVKSSFIVEAIIILVVSLILVIFGALLMNVFGSL